MFTKILNCAHNNCFNTLIDEPVGEGDDNESNSDHSSFTDLINPYSKPKKKRVRFRGSN